MAVFQNFGAVVVDKIAPIVKLQNLHLNRFFGIEMMLPEEETTPVLVSVSVPETLGLKI